ncbi:MAG: hypothetical protein HP491_16585 [Nitrospira sp.]|nr:hypothetical protein [Nitrospira sp.]MBH0184204.1 hypothetical protein [Nitrospira sp.]
MLYEGKAKKIFAAARTDQVVHYFKDDATAFNAEKRGTIVDKGVVNNKMSERMFTLIEENRIPTHFLKRLSDREMLTAEAAGLPVQDPGHGWTVARHPWRTDFVWIQTGHLA